MYHFTYHFQKVFSKFMYHFSEFLLLFNSLQN